MSGLIIGGDGTMPTITQEQKLLKELILVTVPHDGASYDVLHRLGAKPNVVKLIVPSSYLSNISVVEVSGSPQVDDSKIQVKNTHTKDDVEVLVYAERFHSIEGDVGTSDLTGTSPVYSDGIDKFLAIEKIQRHNT
jgi:hypothetical protein